MKQYFRGYIPYEKNEQERLWKNALVVIDTNIILNFYRYSSDTRNEIWKILDHMSERLWIPYQVGMEYFKNKENVIKSVEDSLEHIETVIEKQFSGFVDKLQQVDKKDINCREKIIQEINRAQEAIRELIKEEQKGQEHFSKQDIVLDKMITFFDGKCGEPANEETLQVIKKEAKRREENKIPPGFCDQNKDENFGDYYIFYDMMEKAKHEQKDIIFVTNDEKPDWYRIRDGKKQGGRPELLDEFYKTTNQLLYICNTKTFVKEYNQHYQGNDVSDKAIEEIGDISKREEVDEKSFSYLRRRRMVRSPEAELRERIMEMKMILRSVMEGETKREDALKQVEKEANDILEKIRFAKYHGKILMLVDELEKEDGSDEAIASAIRKLNFLILHMK